MKKLFILFCIIFLLTGCTVISNTIVGSKELTTNTFDLTDFDEVDISHAFDVKITQGAEFEVTTTVNENLFDDLIVEKNGDTLKVGLKPNLSLSNVTLECIIVMPSLKAIQLSGATSGECFGFETNKENRIAIDISGASNLKGRFEADSIDFDLSGACNAEVTGSASYIHAEVSGASDLNIAELNVLEADLDVSGASEVIVNASDSLSIDASGASTVKYKGNPTVKQDTSGASSIKSVD